MQFLSSTRAKVAACFATAIAIVGIGLATAGPASAQYPPGDGGPTASTSSCSPSPNAVRTDSAGQKFTGLYYCNNFKKTPLYRADNLDSNPVNYVYSGRNWVVCAKWFPTANPTTSASEYNHYWAWTLGDVNTGDLTTSWGWMPLTYIKQGGNDGNAGIKSCNF